MSEVAPGRILWVGLAGPDPAEGLRRVRELGAGGVVLFARNISSATQLAELVDGLRREDPSLLVALDQEGGRVDRLRPLLGPSPPARVLGRRGPEVVRSFARLTGRALALLGVQVDFAPVLDLDHRRDQAAIGDRSLAADPEEAARRARAFLDGLEEAGVVGCLKHWPGLGLATLDPHARLPRIEGTEEEIARETRPFRRLAAEAPMVMTAHCLYPALDAEDRPATCSPPILGLLREAGFRGCLVADDLEMGAITGVAEAARESLKAGCDALLLCGAEGEAARVALDELDREAAALAPRLRQAREKMERVASLSRVPAPGRLDRQAWRQLRDAYRRFCDPFLEEAAGKGPAVDPTER